MNARPKFEYIRSPKLLRACRYLPCQLCGVSDQTICAAHSNQAKHGKGRSIKASDIYVAALCHSCHAQIDQGRDLSEAERVERWDKAHVRTLRELALCGLWPKDVELPSYV
jgi:heterodisulfide reductase subunit B